MAVPSPVGDVKLVSSISTFMPNDPNKVLLQGAKKIIFTACHSGKLKLAFTSPDRHHSTSPQNFLTRRIDFTVLLLIKFLKKHHLPFGRVKNRIHLPDSKIHKPRAIGHYFLCMLFFKNMNNVHQVI